jgi:hypothetical protein
MGARQKAGSPGGQQKTWPQPGGQFRSESDELETKGKCPFGILILGYWVVEVEVFGIRAK